MESHAFFSKNTTKKKSIIKINQMNKAAEALTQIIIVTITVTEVELKKSVLVASDVTPEVANYSTQDRPFTAEVQMPPFNTYVRHDGSHVTTSPAFSLCILKFYFEWFYRKCLHVVVHLDVIIMGLQCPHWSQYVTTTLSRILFVIIMYCFVHVLSTYTLVKCFLFSVWLTFWIILHYASSLP